ncbi:hypothetical protein GCM10020331_086000 [Ectobacillus funiculus]
MKQGIICLGEALIDFIPTDETNLTYQKCPGGAPANVAVGVARLGAKSTFLGKLGDDVLGKIFLKETLQDYGVDTSYLPLTSEAKKQELYLLLLRQMEKEALNFFVNRSADQLLSEEDMDESLFEGSKLFAFWFYFPYS